MSCRPLASNHPIRIALLTLVGPLIALATPAHTDTAIIRRHDMPDSSYIALARHYRSVVHLWLPTTTGAADGEGTLIAPRWVLTAAHLVEHLGPRHEVTVAGARYQVDSVIAHPDWDGGPHDIALLRLDRDVVGLQPARLHRGHAELDQVLVLVGYGDIGTGLSGPISNDAQVRAATNRVDEATMFWLKMRFDAPADPRVTPLEGVSGPGDSGGPAYLQGQADEVIAGVGSGQSSRATGGLEGRYGVVEYYTRVSQYVGWIEGVTGPLEP